MKKIRKIIFSLTFFFALGFAGADLYKPHRFFEIGSDTEALAANSRFNLSEIMVKNLVIDLKDLYSSMPDGGFSFASHISENVFMNINFSSSARFSFFTGIDANGYFNIDKEIFRILAKGTNLNENEVFEMNFYADAFYSAGFSFQTLIRDFGVKFSPSIYVPLAYVRPTKATAHLEMSENGKISVTAQAPLKVFSAVNLKKILEDDEETDEENSKWHDEISASQLLRNAGFDFSFEAERNFFHGFNASLFGRIPIMPGKIRHKMTANLSAYFYETNTLGAIESLEAHDFDYTTEDIEYSSANEKIFRPLKLGFSASYRPFGEWITLRPRLDFVLRDPYSSDMQFFPEYNLTAQISVFNILGLSIGSAYEYRIFIHHLGVMLNLRTVEILARVSLCGTDFMNSFKYTGAGAFAGIRIGL